MKKIILNYSTGSSNSDIYMARMFDITYLFNECVGNVMYTKGFLKNHPMEISEKEFIKFISMTQTLRNDLFSISDRQLLENYEQRKIEKIFYKALSIVDFNLVHKNPNIVHDYLYIRKAGIDISNKNILEQYLEKIFNRFRFELNNLGLDDNFIKKIISDIKLFPDNVESILIEIYGKVEKNGNINSISKEGLKIMNGMVREMQAIDHYREILLGDNVTNELFFKVIDLRDFYKSIIPKDSDKENYFKLILDTHEEIDKLTNLYDENILLLNNNFNEYFKKLEMEETEGYYNNLPKDLNSILHHLLDWYGQICPEAINKKEPKKIAVIIFILYKNIVGIFIKDYSIDRIEKEFLMKFGGWKDSSNFNYLGNGHLYNFINTFYGDIELLISNSIKLKKNWKNLWKKNGGYLEEDER